MSEKLRVAAQQALEALDKGLVVASASFTHKALRAALAEPEPVQEPTLSQRLVAAGFSPRDRRLTCDSCGGKFGRQILPIHKCPAEPVHEPVAKAWAEGYRQGVQDERTSETNIGIAGFGAKVEPARQNPYGTTPPQRPAQPVQEPLTRQQAGLRRGDILRCVESGVLCTVWATSTSGKALVKWGSDDFGSYTAEQIGELFWVEPRVQEPVAWLDQDINCAYTAAEMDGDSTNGLVPLHIAPPQREPLTDDEISVLFSEAVQGDKSVHWLCRAVERAVRGEKE